MHARQTPTKHSEILQERERKREGGRERERERKKERIR
jgi:hypothetical protein